MKIISDQEAIKRVITYCKEHDYKILTEDFASNSFKGDILSMKNTRFSSNDNYSISTKFNGSYSEVAGGRLLEILFDLKLLGDDILDPYVTGVDMMRSTIVRNKWDRLDAQC